MDEWQTTRAAQPRLTPEIPKKSRKIGKLTRSGAWVRPESRADTVFK
jgi:hypothetical protein